MKMCLKKFKHCQTIKKVLMSVYYGSRFFYSFIEFTDYMTELLSIDSDKEEDLEQWLDRRYPGDNSTVFGFNYSIVKLGDLNNMESHITDFLPFVNMSTKLDYLDVREEAKIPHGFYKTRKYNE